MKNSLGGAKKNWPRIIIWPIGEHSGSIFEPSPLPPIARLHECFQELRERCGLVIGEVD